MAEQREDFTNRLGARWLHWLARAMPTRESLASNRWVKPIGHRFLASELWRFTRRSVPLGVAVGLFSGFILPLGQIPLAVILAPLVRANVPVAVISTFITNPFTFPFFMWMGNRVGKFMLQMDSYTHGEVLQTHLEGWLGEWLFWAMGLAGVTGVGLAVMAIVSSSVGYFVTKWIWAWWVGEKWKQRRLKRRKLAAARAAAAAEDD